MADLADIKRRQIRARLAAQMGHATQPPSAAPVGAIDRARQALQGATANFGDEVIGLLGAVANIYGSGAERLANMPRQDIGDPVNPADVYRDIRDAERAQIAQFRAERPVESAALEAGGGMLTGGLAGSRFAASAPGRAMAAAPLPNRMAAASGLGAAAAGATAAGQAPTMADIPGAVASPGTAIGALAGPVGEAGASLAGRMVQALSPQRSAERMVGRAIQRSDMTPAEAGERVQQMGEGAMLADVGEGTRAQLESLAQQPGTTMARVRPVLEERSRGAADVATEPFGPGRVIEMGRTLAQQREAQASPLYRQAFAEGVPHTDVLQDLFSRPAVVRAWRQAKARGQDVSGIDPSQLGDVRPSLEGWQATKELLDDRVAALRRSGRNKQAREIEENIIRPLLAELDSHNPAYQQARQLWAGSMQFNDMMERGRSFLTDSASVTADLLLNMSDIDKAAYRVGIAQAIEDRLDRMGELHDVSKLFRQRGIQKKLRQLFSGEELADMLQRVDTVAEQQRTMGQVLSGSQTSRREAMREEGGLMPAAIEAAADVATGMPAATMAGQGVRNLARRVPTSREATRNLAGRMLSEQSPLEVNRMMQLIERGGTPYQRGTLGIGAAVPIGIGAGVATTERER